MSDRNEVTSQQKRPPGRPATGHSPLMYVRVPALRFTVLTAARTGETRLAKWREVDLAAREWTIPEERMKAGEEHTVPLSDAAFAIF